MYAILGVVLAVFSYLLLVRYAARDRSHYAGEDYLLVQKNRPSVITELLLTVFGMILAVISVVGYVVWHLPSILPYYFGEEARQRKKRRPSTSVLNFDDAGRPRW